MFRDHLSRGGLEPRGSHAVVRMPDKTGERARASIPQDVDCGGTRER